MVDSAGNVTLGSASCSNVTQLDRIKRPPPKKLPFLFTSDSRASRFTVGLLEIYLCV
jgi:hypothetical protein